MNPVTGEVLYAKNTDKAVPIASITKLMTVMVVLDAQLPLDEAITISEADVDYLKNTNSRLQIGSVLSRAELMLLALMSSENRAAHALARTYTGGEKAAIAAMNRKAATLGMTQAHFEDGTGLSSHNVASPKDLVAMVKAANTYPLIRRFSTTGGHAIELKNAKLEFNNTNALVKNPDWEIGVSKTGYINEAGKCLVMQAKIKSTPVVIVLMDSWGKYTRIGDAVRVKKWLESSTKLIQILAINLKSRYSNLDSGFLIDEMDKTMHEQYALSEEAITRLEDYLDSDENENGLNFCGTHGFLCAITVGPVTEKALWLDALFEGQVPQEWIAELEAWQKSIHALLYHEQTLHLPCELVASLDDDNDLTDWCVGFMEGMFCNEEAWYTKMKIL
jgi:D-alanyl-D-alanine endopeptidase (penicillin-binding protein 7)